MAQLHGRLPPYLLAHAIEYAAGDHFSALLRLGVVSKAFLEALKFVEFLHVDTLMPRRMGVVAGPNASRPLEYDGFVLSHRYDTRVRRWCEIASAGLKNVSYMQDNGGNGSVFNAAQTRAIVDCAASFQKLTKLEFWGDCEPASLCTSLAGHVRAGRFTSLKRLHIAEPGAPGGDHRPCFPQELTENSDYNRRVKMAVRDLMSHLPINMALYIHLGGEHHGLYPYLLAEDNDFDSWRSELFELLDKGADINAWPILIYMLEDFHFVPFEYEFEWRMDPFDAHLEAFYSTIEALLVRGADPNLSTEPFRGHDIKYGRRNALNLTVDGLHSSVEWVPTQAGDKPEALYRMLMRTIDLLLRHGARDPWARLYSPRGRLNLDVGAWILARADCTPLLRQDVLRGA